MIPCMPREEWGNLSDDKIAEAVAREAELETYKDAINAKMTKIKRDLRPGRSRTAVQLYYVLHVDLS